MRAGRFGSTEERAWCGSSPVPGATGETSFAQDRDGCRVKCVQHGYSKDTDSPYQAVKMFEELSLSRKFSAQFAVLTGGTPEGNKLAVSHR